MAVQYTSADLLQRFNDLTGRPASGDSMSDAQKYARLADAQNVVWEDAVSRVPQAFYSKAAYGSTPTLTTTDQQIFTFGTDVNGSPLFPVGKFRIFQNLQSIPDYPWVEGIDYLVEGSQIRIPNNQTWGGTLYWRGAAPLETLSASVQPSITPTWARILIVYEAVRRYAEEGKRDTVLADRMLFNYERDFRRWMLTIKTQFSNGGAGGSISGLRLSMLGPYSNSSF